MSLFSLLKPALFGALLCFSTLANACFISMSSQEAICYGSSITLSPIAIPAGGTYLWSTGETTPTITVSPGVTTSYTLTYTNGPCMISKSVNVIVSIADEVDEIGMAVCTDVNGNGVANLLSTGLTQFWEDENATIPIVNPSSYAVQITQEWDTVYATTGNPPCYDVLYTVLLCRHKQIDQSEFIISQFPEEVCEIPNYVTLVYTVPQTFFQNLCPGYAYTSYGTQTGYPGNPWISTNGFAYPFNYQNGNFGFAAFAFTNIEDDITVTFDKIDYYSSGCPLVDFEPDITFVVQTNLINLSVNDLTTCEGSSVDLNGLASTTSTYPISFHTDPSASAASVITSPYIVSASQTIYAKITNPNPFCENIKPIDITVLPNIQVNVVDGQVCQNQGLDLSTLTVSPSSTGVWTGTGISNNVFTSVNAGNYTLTFTPTTPCYLPDEVEIEVLPQPIINLGSTTVCDISGIFQLSGIQDPLFSAGQWSGTNVDVGTFDPSGLQGNYSVTFIPSSQYVCAQPTSTQVTVVKAVEPLILDQLFCENQGPIDLNTLVDPQFLGGIWTGQGTNGNTFNPLGLSGAFLLSYNAPSACALPTDVLVEVQTLVSPIMFDADWCRGPSTLDLRSLEDPFYGGGSWSGPGVFGAIWDPLGQNTITTLTYNSNNFCTKEVTINITLFEPIQVDDLSVICNGNEYTVAFNIEGGNPEKWLVNGLPAGNSFLFGPIPSDTAYLIEVTDSSRCTTVILEGNKKCACFKDAGTLIIPVDTLIVCHSDTLRLTHNNDELLQAGDSLTFVFHDNPGWSPGNIIAISNRPVFVKPPGIAYNRVYFVSPLAAEVLSDTINLADPCLSLKAGVPVMFYQPSILPAKDSALCRAACASYPISFEGTAPYSAIVSWGNANWMVKDTLFTFNKDTVIRICPQILPSNIDTIQVNLVQISDQSCEGSPRILGKMVLTSPNITVIDPLLCSYDSLVYRGKVYKKNDPADTLRLVALSAAICDTTVIVSPRFLDDATQIVSRQLCSGQSITINGKIYDETNPSGVEVLEGASYTGCDSVIVVHLTFGNQSVNEFSTTLCRGDSLVINGRVYDEANLSGEELLPGAAEGGCDSLIRVSIQLAEQAVGFVNPVLCNGQSITVNGVVYNESKQVGQEIIENGSVLGCDSIINVVLQFKSIDTTFLNQQLCLGDSVVIDNVVYNATNPFGKLIYQTASGCDSVVQLSLSFFDQPKGNYNASICRGDTIVVNNVSFYEARPTGTVLLQSAASNGCDSLLNVAIDFLDESRGTFTTIICDGDTIALGGDLFYKGKTSGSILFKGAAFNGCDSILNVSIDVLPVKTGKYETILCAGDTLQYAENQFYEGKNEGQVRLPNGAKDGCDSLVDVLVTFLPQPAVDTLRITAEQESDTFQLGTTLFDLYNAEGVVKLPDSGVNGCDSLVYVFMTFPQTFRNLDWSTTPASCIGKEDGGFTLKGADGCVPDRIIINGMVYPIVSLPYTVNNLPAGQYEWRLESSGRCSYTGQFVIEENSPTDFLIQPTTIEVPARSETLVSIQVSPEPSTILWMDATGLSCSDCLMPVITAPESMFKYQLVLGDENGCKRDYEITVIPLEPISVWPNVMYIDGGGVNSVFTVPNDNNALNSVAVYDRWGNALVRQNNFIAGQAFVWDGTAGNQRVMQGVYMVVIQYNDGSTEWLELTVL